MHIWQHITNQNFWCHSRIYMLRWSKHTYWPMKERELSKLFYELIDRTTRWEIRICGHSWFLPITRSLTESSTLNAPKSILQPYNWSSSMVTLSKLNEAAFLFPFHFTRLELVTWLPFFSTVINGVEISPFFHSPNTSHFKCDLSVWLKRYLHVNVTLSPLCEMVGLGGILMNLDWKPLKDKNGILRTLYKNGEDVIEQLRVFAPCLHVIAKKTVVFNLGR